MFSDHYDYASIRVPEVSFLIGYYTQIPVRLSPTEPVIIHFYLFYKPDYRVSAVRKMLPDADGGIAFRVSLYDS